MAESSVSFLVNNLSRLILYEAELLGGLKFKVEYIRDELEHMKAFLRVADSKEESDPQLGAWVKQVREIAYDIEDVLDNYMLQFPHRGVTGCISIQCIIFNLVPACLAYIEKIYVSLKHHHQLASEIKRIKLRVGHAAQGYQRYNTETYTSSTNQNSSYDGRGDAFLLEDADVVGLENPKKKLFRWIFSMDYKLKVISLVGMGGSGKTTIVKKVYDDQSVTEKFDHHVWITISESYDVEILLREVINLLVDEVKQPIPQNLEGMNKDKMKEFIYKFLQHKKYIFVLDDIWNKDAWEAIRYAFPDSTTKGCGCIIVTTRFATIGNAISGETKGHVFQVEPLPKDEAKQLFFRKAFFGESCPLHLLKISESILKKCNGLPLAIIVIGGLLATKNQNHAEWDAFNNSLGDELKDERMNKMIALSFYDLPYYLKSCFLYLSLFPEDEFLDRWRLIRLWVAESFVEEKPGKTMEEVAQGYLNELVNRSLIQVAERSSGGHPTHYRIHDIVREYILLKSSHEVVARKNGRDIGLPGRIRRIAFDASFTSDLPESYRLESLRSMLLVRPGDSVSGEIISKVLRRGCRLLKELDLRGASIEIIPDEVYKLYHLKYLSLRNTKISQISKSIKYLRNLETLDLKSTSVIELPVEVLKLQKLRHLLVYRYKSVNGYFSFHYIQSFKFPYEIGRLSSLQKLLHLIADEVGGMKTVIEIGKLTQLRRLGLINIKKENGMELCSSLAKLTNLRSLNLQSSEEDEVLDLQYSPSSMAFPFLHTLVLDGRLLKIPEWVGSLAGLTKLVLRWSRLGDINEEDPLKCLHGLHNLRYLDMDSAYEGEELNFKVGFQRLKTLSLRRLRKLRRVRVEEGSMPLLKELFMSDCKMVEDVPEGIQHLSHLQFVQFLDMSQAFSNTILNQTSKGSWKLEHVVRVGLGNFVDGAWEGGWVQKLN